jgi:hypothetical protein
MEVKIRTGLFLHVTSLNQLIMALAFRIHFGNFFFFGNEHLGVYFGDCGIVCMGGRPKSCQQSLSFSAG